MFAYARATVPRLGVILRKSYGGAYIVMDSKRMGNDVCLAWPWAELAVMGAGQAAAILQRRATPEERAAFEADYAERLLNPTWPPSAATSTPSSTRPTPGGVDRGPRRARPTSASVLVARKHGNEPLCSGVDVRAWTAGPWSHGEAEAGWRPSVER